MRFVFEEMTGKAGESTSRISPLFLSHTDLPDQRKISRNHLQHSILFIVYLKHMIKSPFAPTSEAVFDACGDWSV